MSEEIEQTEEEKTEDAQTEETVTEEVPEAEPVNELSRPAVIDLPALLSPVSEPLPAGEYMRYSGVYDEIGEARRADELYGQEDIQSELKVAEFPKVVELSLPVIEKESKDLQIAAWLSEALVEINGFAGLRDSLKLLVGLQENFWDALFPEIDEGDMEGRANALAWMDKTCGFSILSAQIIDGDGYNYLDFQDSKKYDIPDDLETLDTEQQTKFNALAAEAKKQNKVTGEKWKHAVTQTRRAFSEELAVAIEECLEELKNLNAVIEEKFDRNQAPSLPELRKSLGNIKTETDKVLKLKREEEPDEIEVDEEELNEDGTSKGGSGINSSKGKINSRREALQRLSELATFFRKTEPHSPVSYLVNRAVKWGNMPLESWLQDVIKDETILFQLRQTLGFNTGSDTPDNQPPAGDEGFVEE